MRRRERDSGGNAVWWVLGGTLVVGGGVAGLLALRGSSLGYSWIGCSLVINDRARFQAAAEAVGRAIAPFPQKPTFADVDAWAKAATTALGWYTNTQGTQSSCSLKNADQGTFAGLYTMVRYFLKGARDGGKLTPTQAEQFLTIFREKLVGEGAEAKNLQEGLP